MQCEIFQTILEEALDNYDRKIVHELSSNLPKDLEQNVEVICRFIIQWTKNVSK